MQIEGEEENIEVQKKLIVFRIIQEALQNVLKHSKASKISIRFIYQKDHLVIKIADNGKGFDDSTLTTKNGLGVQNIFNRAALIGGNAQITSEINLGTNVTVTSPYF